MFFMWHEAKLTFKEADRNYLPSWALVALGGYLAWNVWYIASGKIPPSILRRCVGLPCPTTGCTRSLLSLLHGDVHASLAWNPFTVPILVLASSSALILSRAAVRKRELVLPNWLSTTWLSVLLMAWVSKFLLGHNYW